LNFLALILDTSRCDLIPLMYSSILFGSVNVEPISGEILKDFSKNISSILHDQIEYPIIYFNSNENVKKFEEYLYTDEAKNIFINYGFKIPQD